MEIEPSPPMKATKLWSIVRIVFYMLRKGLTKSKLMLDLHLMLKQGKIASKTLTHLMLHHPYSSTFGCRPDDVTSSFISPRAYEFSCSNSPLIPRRKHYHHRRHRHQNHQHDINAEQKVFDVFDEYESSVEGSPMIDLPGFGRSPTAVRQLRVTDSPFSIKDVEENTSQVDKAAEEFIKKFYKELMEQQKITAGSPSPRHKWGR